MSIRPLIMGASGRIGNLLRLAWGLPPNLGFAPVWQSRVEENEGPDQVVWSLAEGAETLAARAADKGVNMILCLAGITPHTLRAGEEGYALNATLAEAALKAGQRLGVKHVFLASSSAVYEPAEERLSESASLRPVSAYGRSKKEMESRALAWTVKYRASAPAVTCLRIGNLVGADQLCLPAVHANAANPVRLDQFSDGQGPCRSYIGPVGLSRVLRRVFEAAAQGQTLPFALNVATPDPVMMSDLLAALAVPWAWQPAPVEAVQSLKLDVTQLCRLHAFTHAETRADNMVAEWVSLGESLGDAVK